MPVDSKGRDLFIVGERPRGTTYKKPRADSMSVGRIGESKPARIEGFVREDAFMQRHAPAGAGAACERPTDLMPVRPSD
jgi:hypothetical protein